MTRNGNQLIWFLCSIFQEHALDAVRRGDLQQLISVLADECPVSDDQLEAGKKKNASSHFPLPPDHWVNLPCSADDGRTLLEQVLQDLPGRTDLLRTLLSAGARADLYSEGGSGSTPLHAAAAAGSVEAAEILLDAMKEKPKVNR